MENFTDVKLEIFVPQKYALKIRDELAKIGVGRIGNYDHCVALSPVRGFFRPLDGANPFDGEMVNEAIQVIKSNHPYEEFLINIFPLANHLFEDKKAE